MKWHLVLGTAILSFFVGGNEALRGQPFDVVIQGGRIVDGSVLRLSGRSRAVMMWTLSAAAGARRWSWRVCLAGIASDRAGWRVA